MENSETSTDPQPEEEAMIVNVTRADKDCYRVEVAYLTPKSASNALISAGS